MGIVESFLGQDFIETKIEQHAAEAARVRKKLESPSQMRKLLNLPQAERGYKEFLLERERYIYHRCREAELKYVAGLDCSKVCEIYEDLAVSWVPAIKEIDFESLITYEHLVYGAQVKSYINKYNAEVFPGPSGQRGWKKVRYKLRRRPRESTTGCVLGAAVIAGSWNLAREIAANYRIDNPFGVKDTLGILISILNNDISLAQQCLQTFTGKHSSINEFPPEREELPKGLLKEDMGLFVEGVRRTTVRHRGMWSMDKWTKGKKPKKAWKAKKYEKLEHKLEDVKNDLIEFGWVLNKFALAHSCIAAKKKLLTKFLSDSNIWSEWVPFEFVDRYMNSE